MKIAASVSCNALLFKNGTLVERVISDKEYRQKNIGDIFNKLHKAGIDGIELSIPNSFSSDDLLAVKKILSKHSVNVLSIHQPIRLMSYSSMEEIEKIFIIAKELQASRIVFHIDMVSKRFHDKKNILLIKKFEKTYHVLACFENMQHHHVLWRNKLFWQEEAFQNFMQKNQLHITLDTSHLAQTKKDIILFFKKNKNLIENIHISDYKPHPFSSSLLANYLFHLPFGKGDLPIKNFLLALKEANYSGHITTEINGSIEDKCMSIKMIKQYT